MYDVIIIGAGVCGSAIARELAKSDRRIAVLESEADICEGTSKANSGIVHAGYDATPQSLKAKLNVRGNEMMGRLSQELDFSFQRTGSLVVCFDESGRKGLEELLAKGLANGVKGLEILDGKEAREIEPGLSEQVVAALYAPSAGLVCPFGLNIALAENAADNGVAFFLNTKVTGITKEKEYYTIATNGGRFEAKLVVNAAGVYADDIHNMVSTAKRSIVARRGEYCLYDKKAGKLLSHTVFQLPSKLGKGILVTPTVHGNLLAGPTAQDIPDKEGVNTTGAGLEKVQLSAAKSVKNLPVKQVITSFAGLRAHELGGDFVIEENREAEGFFDVLGIASPGLSSAPAIGEYVAELIEERYPAGRNPHFISVRKGIRSMAEADESTRREMIKENPAYANVICRCELVTEGEILASIHRTLGATTLDGVKRRTRAGMGRCQSGFCSPKVVEILARELGKDMGEITKSGNASGLLMGQNKEKTV